MKMINKKSFLKKISFLLIGTISVQFLIYFNTPLPVKAGRGSGSVADTRLEFPSDGNLTAGEEYKVTTSVSVENLTIPEDTDVDIEGGNLTVTGNLINKGNIDTYEDSPGKLYVKNVFNYSSGDIDLDKSEDMVVSGVVFNKGDIYDDTARMDLYNTAPELSISGVDSFKTGYYTNEHGGPMIYAPSPYTLWIKENGSWSKVSSSKTIEHTQTVEYCLADGALSTVTYLSTNGFNSYFGQKEFKIKEKAELPSSGNYYSVAEPYYSNVFFGSATFSPVSGYPKIRLLQRYSDMANGTEGYSYGELGEGTTVNLTITSSDLYGQLIDDDGQASDRFLIGDIIILDNDFYEFETEPAYLDREENPVYAGDVTIKAKTGYSISFTDNSPGSSSLTISETMRNPKLYVKGNKTLNEWVGPIEIGPDIVIEKTAPIPENPYKLDGTKYKDKYYQSDVILRPAEGYKVTTSLNSEPQDSLKYTKTTKNVKIYLYDEYGRFTGEIKVGDIYVLRDGEGKVTVNDLFYGGKVIPVVSTKTNDIKKVSYKYKKADGGDYLKEVPSEVGKYVVEATFEMTEDYKELVVKDEFEISYLPTPANPYSLEGTKGENEFFISDVKIVPANGYRISTTIKTGYTDSIGLDKNGDIGYVYLQKISTGEMTDKIAIKEIMIDKDLPVVTGISNNEVIYTDSKQIVIKDDNLDEVSVNGVKVAVSNGQAVIDLSADNGIMDYTIVMNDKAGHKSTIYVTLITAWMKEGNVQEGVPLKLYPGYSYNFPEGSTWTIDGDPTVYKGGNKFVVTSNVEIKFKKG